MISDLNLRVKNDMEAIHQITGYDYPEIRKVVRANGHIGYVLPEWVQIPEKSKLESAGFSVGVTTNGGTFIYE